MKKLLLILLLLPALAHAQSSPSTIPTTVYSGKWYEFRYGFPQFDSGVINANISIAANISSFRGFVGSRLVIQDTVQGGTFDWYADSLTVDNGIIFRAANGGRWKRDITQAHGIKPEFFGAKGDGVTNDRAAFQAALNYLNVNGRGRLLLSAKTYLVDSLTWYSGIDAIGMGLYNYTETEPDLTAATTLLLPVGSGYMITCGAINAFGFHNISFEGNNGDVTKTGTGIISNIGARAMSIENCRFYHFNIGIAGNSMGDARIVNSIFRNNQTGAKEFKDSDFLMCTFSSNRAIGLYLNNGQVNIIGGFVEWNRTLPDTSATGIYLDGNCDRILIANIKDDHNAGSFVVAKAFGGKSPHLITVSGCQIKRDGWGVDLTDIDRSALEFIKCSNVHVVGNTFWSAGYGAGGTAGVYAPSYVMRADSTDGLVFKGNDYIEDKQKIDLSDSARSTIWTQTGTEWYLQSSTIGADGTQNPWIGQPNYVGYDSAQLTPGTLGSLSPSQWAWGDPASLGYSTVVVRLTGDQDPNTIGEDTLFAYYDHNVYYVPGVTHFQTDEFRDRIPLTTITSGGTASFWVYSAGYTSTNSNNSYTIAFSARQTTLSNWATSNFYFSTIRLSGITTIKYGGPYQPISDFSVGTSASNDLQVTITSDLIGTRFRVTLKNNTANSLAVRGELKW